jgi:hypothetical protein
MRSGLLTLEPLAGKALKLLQSRVHYYCILPDPLSTLVRKYATFSSPHLCYLGYGRYLQFPLLLKRNNNISQYLS